MRRLAHSVGGLLLAAGELALMVVLFWLGAQFLLWLVSALVAAWRV